VSIPPAWPVCASHTIAVQKRTPPNAFAKRRSTATSLAHEHRGRITALDKRAAGPSPRTRFSVLQLQAVPVMPPSDDITAWLGRLRAGDAAALEPLWQTYFPRLVTMARGRLREGARASADEEDVALSALDSFCRGVEAGRFPRLDDRHDLWQVLIMLTARKAIDLARRQGRQKRGGARVQRAADRAPNGSVSDVLDSLAARGPTPEEAAILAEECGRLLARLDDDLRRVALWKMEGFSNAEVAVRLGRSESTVERKLKLIRKCWEL